MNRLASLAVVTTALLACGPKTPPSNVPHTPTALAATPAYTCPPSPPPWVENEVDSPPAAANVVAVCVVGVSANAQLAARRVLLQRASEPVSTERIASDLLTLERLRRFSEVAVLWEKAPGGIAILYSLTERPLVASVSVEGASAGNVPKVEAIQRGAPFDPRTAHMIVTTLKDEYLERGYAGAKVEVTTTPAAAGSVDVHVRVVEGRRWTFDRLVFPGASQVPTKDLEAATKITLGEPYSKDIVDRAELLINALYYDRGYVTANVFSDRTVSDDGRVTTSFRVQEGELYRVGKLKMKKLGEPHEKALLAILLTKTGKAFSRATMSEDLVKIRAFFANKNVPVAVTPALEVDPKTRTLAISIEVERE